jgi:tetratricopeptide (TPR) repeat protein
VVFVADDLAAWLIGFLAEAGRKKLTSLVLGDDQKRALRPAATEAVLLTAAELCPGDAQRAEELAIMIGQLFKTPVPGAPLGEQATALEALQAAIAGQLALLNDPGLTVTVKSLTGIGDVPATMVAQKLTGHLVREIMTRGSRGGPLAPLADQLNHDRTYLHGLQMEGKVDRLDDKLLEVLALLGGIRAVAVAPTALAQLPAVTAGFTGRDGELAVLAGLLDPAGPGGPVVVSAVAGLAGVGKTTLAVQAGHAAQRQGWFGGGVLFVDLHGYDETPVEPSQALDALLRALGVLTEHIPPTVEERAGLYRSVLAEFSEPVLVIADNASAEAQVRPLLPGSGPHKVVVTSRHTLARLGARLVDVTVLDDDASVELLDGALRAAHPDDDRISTDRAAAGRLAGVCGGLPLALQVTAALLQVAPALSAGELAGELSEEKDRLAALRYDDGSGPGAPSVAAAFELSYRRLDETSARVFRLLPVNPGPDVSTAAVAVLADLPASQVRRVLARLAAAHLAEAAPGAGGRWRMHDLLRLYAQQLSDEHADADGREQARDRLLGYYLNMTDAATGHLRALLGTAVPEEFTGREDALAWLDAERASLVAAVTMAAETGRDHAAMQLPLLLAEYFAWRRRFDDWIAIATIGLDAAWRLGDRYSEGMALGNLGIALRYVQRFEEAITSCQDAAAIFWETGDRNSEGSALTNLGIALVEVQRFEEAITAHQDAAAIYRETGDRHREGMALTNLGIALREVQRFEEAITAHQDAAAIFRETGDRHGEGMALNNLGAALRDVQRFEEAITAYQDATAVYRETGDRHSEGMALTNLGAALRDVQRFEEAITSCQEAAAIYRETGDRHSEGMALNNLGAALRDAQRFDEAITAHQDAAAIFRESGDRHSEGMALGNLGLALREAQRFEEAITSCQDAAAIFRETGDWRSEDMALSNLAAARDAERA